VRDWLRYATSRFRAKRVVFGHGTSNARDEAAFLILETLHLAIDSLDTWLDARLTETEREAILDMIERRIATRKPASYLTGTAYIQGHRFAVDERVIVPRSYIGELLCDGTITELISQSREVGRILDLCTGSGALAILAAMAFPEASIDATDVSSDALQVACSNIAEYGLTGRITLREGHLFAAAGDTRYDIIIANPPYVPAERVAAFPAEYAAEPRIAHLGGEDGLDLVRRIIADAPRYVAPDGILIVEVGAAQAALEREYPRVPFLWLDTTESEGEVFVLRAEDLVAAGARNGGDRQRAG